MQSNGVDYLEKIEALARIAPTLDFLVQHGSNDCVEYDVVNGFAVGMGLLNDHECAVQKLFAAAGTHFPEHQHDETEFMIVVSGAGKYVVNGQEYGYGPLDVIVIPPKARHEWYYESATKVIILTIPAAKGFPGGRT